MSSVLYTRCPPATAFVSDQVGGALVPWRQAGVLSGLCWALSGNWPSSILGFCVFILRLGTFLKYAQLCWHLHLGLICLNQLGKRQINSSYSPSCSVKYIIKCLATADRSDVNVIVKSSSAPVSDLPRKNNAACLESSSIVQLWDLWQRTKPFHPWLHKNKKLQYNEAKIIQYTPKTSGSDWNLTIGEYTISWIDHPMIKVNQIKQQLTTPLLFQPPLVFLWPHEHSAFISENCWGRNCQRRSNVPNDWNLVKLVFESIGDRYHIW